MIYNFVEYLKTEFPTETIYTNINYKQASQDFIPDRIVLVRETGGVETAWFNFARKTIQIITRDIDPPKARELAWDIYDKFMDAGVFGLILPVVTVDGTSFPQLQTSAIIAIQQPQSMGVDAEGRTEFSTNYEIKYRRT